MWGEYSESSLSWCDIFLVCRGLEYFGIVCLEVMGAVVHVKVLACVSMVFCVCWGGEVCVGMLLWVFGVFVDAVSFGECLV